VKKYKIPVAKSSLFFITFQLQVEQFGEEEELLTMLRASLAEKQADIERLRTEVADASSKVNAISFNKIR
jgi:hypothetical protein